MSDNFDSDFVDEYSTRVIPVIRVYISYLKENNDMLDIGEVVAALGSNDKSPSENIKDYIDKGMINIYACSFNQTVKVI